MFPNNCLRVFSYFQNVTMNVKNNLNIIERLQKQYANIELADRRAIERSFEMINFWSILHLILMIFALYVQVSRTDEKFWEWLINVKLLNEHSFRFIWCVVFLKTMQGLGSFYEKVA